MSLESVTIGLLTPVIAEGAPFLAKRLARLIVAEVVALEPQSVPIRISNGVAYGTFSFRVFNRRGAFVYNKYSIPFLDYFKTEPKWNVTDSKYGYIDAKNVLQLYLDNIPRNQAVIVTVDTEAKVDVSGFVRVKCEPPILSEKECDVKVEIINTRDFPIFGFAPQIRAVFADAKNLEVRVAENKAHEYVLLPKEFVSTSSISTSDNKAISWDVDLVKGEIKRFKVSLR